MFLSIPADNPWAYAAVWLALATAAALIATRVGLAAALVEIQRVFYRCERRVNRASAVAAHRTPPRDGRGRRSRDVLVRIRAGGA